MGYLATATSQNFRNQLAEMDREMNTTTGAGNAGGTTVVCSGLTGRQVDYYRDKYLLITSGTCGGAADR